MSRRIMVRVSVGGILLAICGVVATGQVREGETAATLGDVVRELQALRVDLRTTATGTLRLQTLVTRMLLQEQRLRAASDRMADVNTQLETLRFEMPERERQARQFDPDGINATRLQEAKQREQQLQARATELSARVAEEQARWNEMNGRLEAFERALPRLR